MNNLLVTGGAGFIGANFVLGWIDACGGTVINLDKLTYAGNLANLSAIRENARHVFIHGDIADRSLVQHLLAKHRPDAIVNFAAESHVDRSIHAPADFIQTNVNGTFNLLEETRRYWHSLDPPDRRNFRFLHVSTDEVYGSLGPKDAPFSETAAYAPNSPYAASKAASDHLVRAYHRTYGLPTLITHCGNNYGQSQLPEKLIPLIILNAIHGKSIPLYGDGLNVRDWIHVNDHCAAIQLILDRGIPGEVYNIGADNEKTNLDVVHAVCAVLDELHPHSEITPHDSLISFVEDRPGHDRRYAIDTRKLKHELGWQPILGFEAGLRQTVNWYLEHLDWVNQVNSSAYREWIELNYVNRGSL